MAYTRGPGRPDKVARTAGLAKAQAGAPAEAAEGKGAPGAGGQPGAGKPVLRRRRRRDNQLDPQGGWALVGDAAGRLGLWEGLGGYLAQRAFALAVQKLVPRLAAHARAERLSGDTLLVRVSSSAVASELTYIRDLLLAYVNDQLLRLQAPPPPAAPGRKTLAGGRARARKQPGPVRRLQHRVGNVAELPDALEWTQVERRPPPPRPPRPAPRIDTQVAQALSQVHDEALRRALSAMYAASINEPDPVRPTSDEGRKPVLPR